MIQCGWLCCCREVAVGVHRSHDQIRLIARNPREGRPVASQEDRAAKWRRYWDRHAPSYDRAMGFFERVLFGDSRDWVCARATGDVLDVAIGTGLNLPIYPADVTLTGIEWSPGMLNLARRRAEEIGREVTLLEGDARSLPFPEASFDTVVCTYSLCAIPDEPRAIAEMTRVLRPGGRLLLADHVTSTAWVVRTGQGLMERITIPLGGEHFVHRPLEEVRTAGLDIEDSQRFKLGVVERLVARKPDPSL